jgi:hypothetical protein
LRSRGTESKRQSTLEMVDKIEQQQQQQQQQQVRDRGPGRGHLGWSSEQRTGRGKEAWADNATARRGRLNEERACLAWTELAHRRGPFAGGEPRDADGRRTGGKTVALRAAAARGTLDVDALCDGEGLRCGKREVGELSCLSAKVFFAGEGGGRRPGCANARRRSSGQKPQAESGQKRQGGDGGWTRAALSKGKRGPPKDARAREPGCGGFCMS